MMVNALSNKLAHDITRRYTWLIAQNKVRKRTSTPHPPHS